MKFKILLFLLIFVNCQSSSEGQQSLYNSQCEQFNYCNNHGYCGNGGMWCMCNPQYSGDNCSQCASGYFNYPVCYSCKSYCQNGGICTNNTCVCPNNATDILCSNCPSNFNGPYCNQNPIGFSVITNDTVYDIGGSSITILGSHFNKNGSTRSTVICSFASYAYWYSGYFSTGNVYYSSSGSVINDNSLVCITPMMYSDSYNISFSLDNGTNWFSDGSNNELSRLTLEVFSYCPTRLNKCSMNGICQYGHCNCSLRFTGEKCDQCDKGYFDYPFCVSCNQFCRNSSSCINGTCICNPPYSGSRCTDCSQENNGKGCLRIPMILSVIPQLVLDVGGNNLTVIVSNFDENITNVLCKFGTDTNLSDISCGYMINRTTINCFVPRMNASWRRLSVSISDGLIWIDSSLYIQVNETCPKKCYLGQCRFGQCLCSTNIAGNSCSSCASGYYQFPNCYSCSICQSNNGTCNQTSDICICGDPLRFTGVTCNECQPNYYGPNCTNNTQIFNVIPRTVTDLSLSNGTNITLIGYNFHITSLSDIKCKFQSSTRTWIVPAISANRSAVTCILSNGTQFDYISTFLSLDNGITWIDQLNVWWMYSVFIDGACPSSIGCSYGRCSYGQCICAPKYTGILCNQCANGYFGYPDCYDCSIYCVNNGTCINGTCQCTERFSGTFCTNCQSHYYGSQCLQIPSLLSVIPTEVPDIGGVNLTVIGEYFNENSTVILCQYRLSTFPFSIQISSGNIINRTSLTCFSPRIESSMYQLYVSMDNGTSWTSSYTNLYVNPSCPNGTNSCNLGQCSFGRCICNNRFIGSTCLSCATGYFNFPNCYPCYYCELNNGTCDRTTDKCICGDPTRFKGTFCNLCQQYTSNSICNNNSQLLNISTTCGYPISSLSTFSSTFMTTFTEVTSSSHFSTSMNSQTSMMLISTTTTTTTTPIVSTNFYIQFVLSLRINSTNTSEYEISIELIRIFTSSFNISSNQISIKITISLPSTRILTDSQAQVRLFDSTVKSAESLLTQIRQQLSDPTSSFRKNPLTSQLTDQSISDVRRIYICEDNKEQETPCQTSTTTKSTSYNSQTPILLATIIPSVIGGILIVIIVIFIIKSLRKNSGKSSKYKQSDPDPPITNF